MTMSEVSQCSGLSLERISPRKMPVIERVLEAFNGINNDYNTEEEGGHIDAAYIPEQDELLIDICDYMLYTVNEKNRAFFEALAQADALQIWRSGEGSELYAHMTVHIKHVCKG